MIQPQRAVRKQDGFNRQVIWERLDAYPADHDFGYRVLPNAVARRRTVRYVVAGNAVVSDGTIP